MLDVHERLAQAAHALNQKSVFLFNCNSDKKQSRGRDRRVWTGSPASRAAPSPALSPPSLQGSEQLGEYNHGGNATGQADKRGLGAGPGRRWGLSVCLFIWLSVKITVLRANGGLGQPVYPWSREDDDCDISAPQFSLWKAKASSPLLFVDYICFFCSFFSVLWGREGKMGDY